ncbi:MAG: DUF2089 domain-containing protein [Chthonomonas sp.]|nr:DUF2089 domain-containing protein [Chthonomonas sp.]
MKSYQHRPIPSKDPISGKPLAITELQTIDGDVTIRSRFDIPRMLQLDEEQYHLLETFLRCRGVINAVERELGLSYPTVKARLDALLQSLELTPVEKPEKSPNPEKLHVIEALERGEITAQEAKERLRGVSS